MKALLTALLLAMTVMLGGCYFNMSVTKNPPYNVVCPGSGASVTQYRAGGAGGGCEQNWWGGCDSQATGCGDCSRPGYCSPL